MDRPASATSLKGKMKKPRQEKPREGTRIRQIYDLLVENAGQTVPLSNFDHKGTWLQQLQNNYGLDIRLIRQGSKLRGPSLYMLVGYYDGGKYVDCMVKEQK